jgi:hypothetical protein
MNIGKLYQFKKWVWILYPSKETANYINTLNLSGAAWTKRVNENFSHIEPNCMFVLLEQDQQYCKTLTANGELGWIVLNDYCIADMDIVEVNSVNSLECSDRVET